MENLSNDTFAKLVAEEVKNKLSPSQRQILIEQTNWERWRQNLVALLENLDEQILANEKAQLGDLQRYESFGQDGFDLTEQANMAYEARIKKISRFRFHVERRLNEVATMIETGKVAEASGWQSVDFLKKGIAKHRSLIVEYDIEETIIDKALWLLLEDKWTFDDIRASDIQ